MWLLVKFSFDINDHIILSLFLRKMCQFDGISHLFDTLHLTSVFAQVDFASILTLFDLYTSSSKSVLLCLAGCACIVKRISNVALELLGDLVLMMAAWYAQYLLLLCICFAFFCCLILRSQASDFRTSDQHLLSATGSPVTPHAPRSFLTTAFASTTHAALFYNCRELWQNYSKKIF